MKLSHNLASRAFYAYLTTHVIGFLASAYGLDMSGGLWGLIHSLQQLLYWSHIVTHVASSIIDRLQHH